MAASSSGSLRWVIGLPVFIVFTCFLFLNAASQLLENTNPTLAATLNPLNTDARINALVAGLNTGNPQLDQLAGEARAIVALAGADARGYSLVGAIEERQGNLTAATASYAAALTRSRPERFALTRMLSLSLQRGEPAEAVRYFDLLLRRWLEFRNDAATLAFDLIADPKSAAGLAAAMSRDPDWRSAVVQALLKRPDGLRFVSELLVSQVARAGSWRDEVASTISALIKGGSEAEAYALFQQTLDPAETAKAGYVFDSGFTQAPGRRGFEWAALSSSAVDASLPAGPTSPGLRIRFLDSPAQLGRPSQMLFLPAGTYTLSSTATGTALVLAKRLYWRVSCPGRRVELAQLDLPEGTYVERTVSASLTVPADCPLQLLALQTGLTDTSSWRDRYGGEILITDVRLSRAAGGA